MSSTNSAVSNTITSIHGSGEVRRASSVTALSTLMAGYDADTQRHIQRVILQAVDDGSLMGYKLASKITLPHSRDRNRIVNKTDIGFDAETVPAVLHHIQTAVQNEAQPVMRAHPTLEELAVMSPEAKRQLLQQQRAEAKRAKRYRKSS